jgi:nickel-dependent lactate racemase
MLALRFGTTSSLSLKPDSGALVTLCDVPRGEPLAGVSAAVKDALAEPLDFPPLVQAAVPGDTVVLALDRGVPQAATIVAQTVELLAGAGVSPANITIIRTQADVDAGVADPRGELTHSIRDAVALRVHDPRDRHALSYLAAASDARPIYMNRAIHDADLVILIGVLRVADSPGYHGINTALFPAFSDAQSLARFRSPKGAASARHNRLRKQADEVAWLLGVRFTIQVVPGAAGKVLHVLAGDPDAVFREGTRRCDEAWNCSVPGRAGLVVATIEGDASEQTWENVGRALAAAAHALDDDGAVVICSRLAEPFGPALQRLAGADDLNGALADIAREPPNDALCAAELARAIQRGSVYLVSRLDEESVEGLGVLPVDERGVARIVGRSASCIVLANAHYARVCTRGEVAAEHPSGAQKSR